MIIKCGLLVLSFLLLTTLVFSFEKFRQDWLVYYLTFGMVVGQTIFPVWFFQGMERMKYITFLNILAKALFTIAIFIFVKEESDYWMVPLLNSLGFMVAGILALWIVFKDFKINFIISNMSAIMYQLIQGWHIFISTVAISLYTSSRVFLVGIFFNNEITGKYAIAEKLINIVQTFPLAPILQVIYPWFSSMYIKSKENTFIMMKKFQNITTFSFLFILSIFYIISGQIVQLVVGYPCKETIITFKILLLAVFFINANAFRVQFLLISGYDKLYSIIHIFMGIVGFFTLFFGVFFWSYRGAAVSIVITALLVWMATILNLRTIMIEFRR